MSRTRKKIWPRLAVAMLLLLTTAATLAQEGAIIRTRVDQIFVPVTVSSREGDPITGLDKDDFRLLEDGMEQSIINFASEEVPLNVVFLMDISHSTFLELGAIKKAVRSFVERLDPEDRVAIITFNNEARLILEWSNDMVRLDRALERVVPKGRTVWYDAMYVTIHDLLPNVAGKKIVISVTDGWDTGSLISFDEVLETVTATDTQLYFISKTSAIKDYAEYYRKEYNIRYDETRLMKVMYTADAQLRKLAWETGGRVINAESSAHLVDIYQNLVRELRQQYYLSYQPHNILRDGRYRKIEVQVERMGARIHHRPGYYAR